MNKYKRIMLMGPSGIGKTTLARWISEETGIEFISGSVSDLIPETNDMPHKDMLSRDSSDLVKEDYQILNLRNKLYKGRESFVTDRSFIDSAAYFTYKQSDKIPACEVEQFVKGLVPMLMANNCDLLIFLSLEPCYLDDWVVEDNNKRITNIYFQTMISAIMENCLKVAGYFVSSTPDKISKSLFKPSHYFPISFEIGKIDNVYGDVDVVKIPYLKMRERQMVLRKILGL